MAEITLAAAAQTTAQTTQITQTIVLAAADNFTKGSCGKRKANPHGLFA